MPPVDMDMDHDMFQQSLLLDIWLYPFPFTIIDNAVSQKLSPFAHTQFISLD